MGNDAESTDSTKKKLQQTLALRNLAYSLLEDSISDSEAGTARGSELMRKSIDIDKTILQMLAIECREGEERGMKALELVTMLRDRSGKMIDAASKVAQRYDRTILDEKIRNIAERRLAGEEDDEYEDEDI